MQVVTTVGLDIAKSGFHVYGVDAAGQVVIRRQLKRRYVLAFFEKLPACWWASRRVPHRTIGRVLRAHSGLKGNIARVKER
jgi:transposase